LASAIARTLRCSRFDPATRPLLSQNDRFAAIYADDVEVVLADIDADDGNRAIEILRHGVLLVVGAPGQFPSLAGQGHGRTIPLEVPRPAQSTQFLTCQARGLGFPCLNTPMPKADFADGGWA